MVSNAQNDADVLGAGNTESMARISGSQDGNPAHASSSPPDIESKGVDHHHGAEEKLLGTKAERKLVRKLDLHIIPVVMGLYLFSFLDRVNIGNARLYGLEEDLGMHGNMYQIAVIRDSSPLRLEEGALANKTIEGGDPE